ncbi:hypothetical protein [Furfurilactobacillus milii]|uniref:Uncharacterized protein n=1 Tax=Furfurilactobacillus milii TaxID=2888272 RepID=A0ABT6DCG6_9LACO|nr:hypothetical protein [Furfurilactobacillus milii]QLE66913.1 hypothetical protein LROSL2_1563 [Furfurilactobacillus rossiae]MCF6161923.1 hypothetical protein [Furfurilactobacillus milii]MCF6164303.1 hypothetical protein [Furfurilactobacillus milii]MDF9914791.1 hypothetical protein [Furfurilactobacillus milii]QLE69343.1 hypothetical protein LROSL3_1564 [Furfurilactobacillus rossiae]
MPSFLSLTLDEWASIVAIIGACFTAIFLIFRTIVMNPFMSKIADLTEQVKTMNIDSALVHKSHEAWLQRHDVELARHDEELKTLFQLKKDRQI